MSQEHENARHENANPADGHPDEGAQALSVLRDVWQARQQTSADLDEECGNTKACKSVESIGFQGLIDDDSPSTGNSSVGNELRAAWRTKLEREGKLNPEASSVRDLVFDSGEPKQ